MYYGYCLTFSAQSGDVVLSRSGSGAIVFLVVPENRKFIFKLFLLLNIILVYGVSHGHLLVAISREITETIESQSYKDYKCSNWFYLNCYAARTKKGV